MTILRTNTFQCRSLVTEIVRAGNEKGVLAFLFLPINK